MSGKVSDPQIPAISLALVAWLERIYPDRAPEPTLPEREVWMQAGQAKLIRNLRTHAERQAKTVLASP